MNISADSAKATYPNVFNVGTNVYVAWLEANTVKFRASPDGGVTWSPPLASPPMTISAKGGAAYPLISANGSNVYVVWSQKPKGSTVAQATVATSTNFGASFNTPVVIKTSFPAITPVIASWGDNVYVAFADGSNSHSFVTVSTDAGATWSTPHEYSTFHEPQLAAWGGQYVYAIAGQGLSVSKNNGVSWVNVSASVPNCCPSEPWIAASGPNVYGVTETKGPCGSPSGGCNVGELHSNDYGATWSPRINISRTVSPALKNSWAPMVNAYGNSAWIADHTHPGTKLSQVYVYTTTNAGTTWNSPVDLSGLSGVTVFPYNVATSDGQNVFVAWSQESSASPVTWIFRVSYSADGGITWSSQPGINVSQNPSGTQAGDGQDIATGEIAAFGTHCYAVWQFIRGASYQIYFSSS